MSYKFSIIVDTEPFVTIRKCLMCDTHVDGIAKTCHVNCSVRLSRKERKDRGEITSTWQHKGWVPSKEELDEYKEWRNKQ